MAPHDNRPQDAHPGMPQAAAAMDGRTGTVAGPRRQSPGWVPCRAMGSGAGPARHACAGSRGRGGRDRGSRRGHPPAVSPWGDGMPGTTIASVITGGTGCAEHADPFGRLRATAIETITRHVADGGGLCRCCGATWPCELACLAEFTLGAL